jgi:starch-binding outer membrane protein, SusD/RagB family
MKMKTYKILLLTGLILFSASCAKFLDEKGYNTDYTYYNTVDGMNALTIACYQNIRMDPSWENGFNYQDMGTDLYMLGADGGQRDGFGQFLSGSTAMNSANTLLGGDNKGSLGLWGNNYQGIAACNLGLQYVQNSALDTTTKAVRKGEMLFLRAFYYYGLVTQFGDIPLVLSMPTAPKTDYLRVPQKQIWSQIISDATQAWSLLPWADINGKVTGDWGRIGKGAAGHLLAKAYMFRYCDKYTMTQSDANMNEDRGGKTTDIDSVIYYTSRVCNFGGGAGNGSNHKLASDFATLWGWNPKTGLTAEYMGTEIVFSINFSSTYFLNNQTATDVNSGGNWLHMFYTMYAEGMPLTTVNGNGNANVSWGSNVGLKRDFLTDRPWRRVAPTPYYYADNGLYAARNYATGKLGKLIDSRLYKGHVWVYYCNDAANVNVKWSSLTNGAGSFDPASIGKTATDSRYGLGDTCMLLSMEDVSKRYVTGTNSERLALARAQEKYWYMPMNSIPVPLTRANTGLRDVLTNVFPTSAKYLDSRRASIADQGGFRNFMKYRLAETYILLSEAYARKGDYANAAAALNVVRDRAAWQAGEQKPMQYWKYDGGSLATRTTSTVSDMEVSAGFLSSFSDNQLTDFYLDEMGHEAAGEMNRFELLVRYGADYWYNRVVADDYFVSNNNGVSGGNIHIYHRFRPIPQTHIDNINPPDSHPQNYGY